MKVVEYRKKKEKEEREYKKKEKEKEEREFKNRYFEEIRKNPTEGARRLREALRRIKEQKKRGEKQEKEIESSSKETKKMIKEQKMIHSKDAKRLEERLRKIQKEKSQKKEASPIEKIGTAVSESTNKFKEWLKDREGLEISEVPEQKTPEISEEAPEKDSKATKEMPEKPELPQKEEIKEENREMQKKSNEFKREKGEKSERSGRPLPDEKIEKIRVLREKGYSLRDIKKILPDVSKSTISKYIRDIKLTEKQKKQLERNNQENRLKNYNKFFKTKGEQKLEATKELPEKKSPKISEEASGFKEKVVFKEFYQKIEKIEIPQTEGTKKENQKKQEKSSKIKPEKGEKPERRGRPLPNEKIEKIRGLRGKGYSSKEIKKLVPDISFSTISKYIKDIKLTEKQKERLHQKEKEQIKKNLSKINPKRRDNARDKLDAIIKQRHGKWDPTEYTNKRTKVKIKCREGHVFWGPPYHITGKEGTWCPECSEGRSERVCRSIFETIFKDKFPKVRPDWLVNDRGNQMELDGYNQKLALAFEYQGFQHYHFVEFFHETEGDFKQRVADDEKKRELCDQNGITLIEIPYTVPYKQMPDYILTKCEENKIEVPEIDREIYFNKIINESYVSSEEAEEHFQSRIEEYTPDEVEE
ncbi:MAG: hypothetical protein HWN66_18160 [Candidatus Helarchaeota archaeon]|nr:hypothetical protein [Candidatus Helarchaeota archaeon]